MNHDATHCLDYGTGCTMACYRARLTKELKEICYALPVSWAHLKGTKECIGWPEIKEGRQIAKNQLRGKGVPTQQWKDMRENARPAEY